MAHFNPKPVTFEVNPALIQSAGAIGDAFRELHVMKLKEEEIKRQQKMYELQDLKYQSDLAKVQSDAQNAFHENAGKAFYVQQNDPNAFNGLSQTYGNDSNGLIRALAGYSGKMTAPKQPQGKFLPNTAGDMYYVREDGSQTPLNFKTTLPQSANPENRSTNEITNYKMYADSLKKQGLAVPSFADFYEQRQNTKTMGVGLRDYDETQNRINSVATKHGIQPEQLSKIDFSKLSPAAQYDFSQTIGAIEQSQKDKLPDWAKKEMVNLSQIVHASGEISKLLNTNDSGMLDRAYNKVNQYLGLGSDAEMARQSMSESAYALYRNHQLKLMSGTAVSGSEEGRSIEAFGELWRNDKSTASKMYENMGSLKSRLEAIKSSYNPIAFNYRYGNLERGVDASMRVMWGAINGKQPTQQGQGQFATSRGEVIQMLQQKGASSQQIDAYLQQKGL